MMKRITKSKRLLSLILSCALLLTGCAGSSSSDSTKDTPVNSVAATTTHAATTQSVQFESEKPTFEQLSDPDLARYMSDSVYNEILNRIDNDKYFVENVESTYVSKEYIEALEFNSQKNIFFGYTLEELDEKFQGKRYVFTLGEDGKTAVKEFEEYQNEYLAAIKDVAIGAGVILFCVTVSAISAGAGAPAISMIFAYGAKSGTIAAVSGGAIGGIATGLVKGIETGDMEAAMKSALADGAKGFKIGAIMGALAGGAKEVKTLYGLTRNGLSLNEAAKIQKEAKFPLDVIKEFKSMDEYEVYKKAQLKTMLINTDTVKRNVLIPDEIDLQYKYDGKTNLELMTEGKAPIGPDGQKYQIHHINQKNDGTLAILTDSDHKTFDKVLHNKTIPSEIDRTTFNAERKNIWQYLAEYYPAKSI